MPNILAKGTLLIPSGPAHDPERKHLHVVCTDECAEGFQVIVPISSYIEGKSDSTCILEPHEHAFLKHKSFALFQRAGKQPSLALSKGVSDGLFSVHDDMNGQTFLRIRNGLCRSKHTPRGLKLYLSCKPEPEDKEV